MPILSNFPGGSGSGGGGLTLAAVSDIKTIVASEKVYISWKDPDDIVLDKSVLAGWNGTLLVRKAGSVPVSRRDGVVVLDSKTRNSYSGSYFCDSGLSDGVTYYYKFFPYTTANAYTDSEDNEFFETPTAQVMGIDSWNVTSMSASSEAGNGKMTVGWTDPAAVITSDGVTLASWAATTIVVKEGDYATSKDDADAAYTLKVTTRNQYSVSALTVTGLTNGVKYYISFFPETTDGGINTSVAQRTTGTANRITIANTPTQNGSLTYNGNAQSPKWNNYDADCMSVSGTTIGTNAGTYTAYFTPMTDYRWASGSTGTISRKWSIDKAAGELSLSVLSVTLDTDNPTKNVTVTRLGDGVITATSDNTDVATVSVNGDTLTISHVNETSGSAVITVEVAEGKNYTAPSDKTISVNALFVSTTLNDNDWATIRAVSKAGKGENYWDVGDCKAVTVSGTVGTLSVNGTYYVYILGFKHDYSKTIDFGTFKTAATGGVDICLIDGKYGNSPTDGAKYFNINHDTDSNDGGWKSCDLRYDVLGSTDTRGGNATSATATSPVSGTLMAALPSDLRAVMKPFTIYTDNVGGGNDTASYVTLTVDYLPLLAEWEISGACSCANSAEQNYQSQYSYFASGNSKIKYKHSATNSKADWWTRSPYCYYGSGWCAVDSFGDAGGYSPTSPYGLAPIFRV